MPKRSFLAITLFSGLAVGIAGTVAAYSLGGPANGPANGPTAAGAPVDRAALEQILADREITPTGQTRRFDLVVQETPWELLPGVTTQAITFNGTVPGPTIRVTEGDAVEIEVTNKLDVSTSIHWHGLHVPNDQDGVAGLTQDPILPGETYSYRFIAPHAGTFMYHSHGQESRDQMDRGLSAPFIIDPQGADPIAADREVILTIGSWMIGDGMAEMDAMSMEYDYFTINGKSFPATESIDVDQGDLVRLRFINPSQTIHPMHLHGTDMAVVAKDGEALPEPQRLNTLNIAQGETYDVVFRADNPGAWLLHCHDLHHASNAGVEPGGLMVVINVRAAGGPAPSGAPSAGPSAQPSEPTPSDAPLPTMDPGMSGMPGMNP